MLDSLALAPVWDDDTSTTGRPRGFSDRVGNMLIGHLAACSDVDVIVDLIVGSDEYRDLQAEYRRDHGPPANWRPLKIENRFRPAVLLDNVLARNLRKGVRLANATSLALQNHPNAICRTTVPEEVRTANPLWFFHDATLPDAIVQGLLAVRRAELEFTLLYYLTNPLIRDIATAQALSRLWVRDLLAHAVFVASIPGMKVSHALHDEVKGSIVDLDEETREQAARLGALASL